MLFRSSGAAFKLPAGAKIKLRVHYKKHWQDEQEARSDRSVVGLYLADAPPVSDRMLEALTLDGPTRTDDVAARTLSSAFSRSARVVAIRPRLDRAYQSVDVRAVLPAGRTVSLLQLHAAQPQWYRRYWFADAVELPAGTRIEVVVLPAPPDGLGLSPTRPDPLQISLDYVPQ